MRPFRFAVQTSTAPDGRAWRERARKMESLGYSTLYIPDHFGDQFGPLVALTSAAEATETLRVGSLVFDNDYRHPVVLAKELATLDLLSEGRLEIGMGAGWMKSDYDESGMPYDRPGVRVDRMIEGLTIMKAKWGDGSATFEGQHYKVHNAQGLPRPYTSPHPPIVIGGGSPRVLGVAAREADIVGINPNLAAGYVGPEVAAESTAERFHQRVQWVKDAAGDRFETLDLQMLTFFVQFVADRRAAAANLAPLFGLSVDDALEVPMALVGTVDDICDTLEERREKFGFNYWVVHEAEMEEFGQVVERLAGK